VFGFVDSFAWGHSKGKAQDVQTLQDHLNRRHAEGYELVHMNTILACPVRGMHEQTSYLVWRRP
jgi:hypothetical protein